MSILKAKKFSSTQKKEKMSREVINPRSTKMLNAMLDASLLKQFKVKTAANGITMTDVLTECIRDYISRSD